MAAISPAPTDRIAELPADGGALPGTRTLLDRIRDFSIDELVQGRQDRLRRSSLGGACYDLAWSASVSGEHLIALHGRLLSAHNRQLLPWEEKS